jgi:hypothetical protein
MHKLLRCLVVTGFLFLLAVPAAAGELTLSIANGKVTLIARDVPVRQILAEWARIGQTRIVNGEKLTGPPVTLELRDVSEAQALEAVLRSASGYVLAQRSAANPGTSVYDRIMILATSRPPVVAEAAPAPFVRPLPQPQVAQMPNDDDGERESGVAQPQITVPQPGTQAVPGAMRPQPGQQQQQAPLTAPRPGMIPQPTNVPVNPYQPPPLPGLQPGAPPAQRPGGQGAPGLPGGPGGSGGPGGPGGAGGPGGTGGQ